MKWLLDLLRNPFLLTAIIGWMTSQTMKIFTHAIVYKEWKPSRFFGDGGIPSSHAATVTSLAIFAGIKCGFASVEFAIAMVLTMVVCRDAVGVRLETGKQAIILNEIKHLFDNEKIDEIKLKEFVGHTPVQVVAGVLWGTTVAIIMSFILL